MAKSLWEPNYFTWQLEISTLDGLKYRAGKMLYAIPPHLKFSDIHVIILRIKQTSRNNLIFLQHYGKSIIQLYILKKSNFANESIEKKAQISISDQKKISHE